MATGSSIHDPNNHVPDATADDAWDDGDWVPAPGAPILPPRKSPRNADPDGKFTTRRNANIMVVEPSIAADEPGDEPAERSIEVVYYEPPVVAARLEIDDAERPVRIAPTPSKPFTPREPRKRSEAAPGESHHWGIAQSNRHTARWMWAAGTTVLLLVAGAVAAWPRHDRLRQAPVSALYETLEVIDNELTDDATEVRMLLDALPDALAITTAFLTAETTAGILPLVRNQDGVAAAIANTWQPQTIPPGWAATNSEQWAVEHKNGRAVGKLVVRLPDHRPFHAFFIRQPDGALLLDWEATTGYGTATFGELAAGTGDGTMVRGLLTSADFHTTAFPEADWRAFRLRSPDRQETIWVYAERGGSADLAIANALPLGEILDSRHDQAVTVTLVPPPPGARPGQWILREMLHIGWVSP